MGNSLSGFRNKISEAVKGGSGDGNKRVTQAHPSSSIDQRAVEDQQNERRKEDSPDELLGLNSESVENVNKGVPTASLPGSTNPLFVAVTPKCQRKNWHKPLVLCLGALCLFLLGALIILAINFVQRDSRVEICETTECLRSAATIRLNLDLSADPCQDFYQYACGNWAEEHPKPDTASMNDWFSERQVRISQNLRAFLKRNNSEHTDDPLPVQQTRTLYRACMDTDAMDSVGYLAVETFMQKIGFPAIPRFFTKPVPKTLTGAGTRSNSNSSSGSGGDKRAGMAAKLLGRIKRYYGKDILIGWDLYPDPRNRTRFRMAVGTPESSGGLPLIEQYSKRIEVFKTRVMAKDQETDKDTIGDKQSSNSSEKAEGDAAGEKLTEREKEMIEAYNQFIRSVIGEYLSATAKLNVSAEQLKSASEKIYKITKYAYKINEQVENMNKSGNPLDDIFDISLVSLQNRTDHFARNHTAGNVTALPFWSIYLKEIFRDSPELKIDLDQELMLTSSQDMHYMDLILGNVLAKQDDDIVELYIWWTLLEDMILYTTDDMRAKHREYLKSVSGVQSSPSRSLYCTTVVTQMMGMALSYGIAEPEFITKTKPKVETMLGLIRDAFYDLVGELHWMDNLTKKETLEKAKRMVSLIGFPEWILNKTALEAHYYGIRINESDYLGTMLTLLDRDMLNNTAQLRQAHTTQWATTPTNVNAFHTFQSNAITVPLAILQFPFYNLGLESLNYGAIGSILGHELTHGFDDSGRHYDKNGNMVQWWTNQTIGEYVNRTQCFVEQYGDFEVPEINKKINGERTLGENIADNGGIREAFMAYQKYVSKYGLEQSLPGFEDYTAEQLFFLSFGNLWCETTTAASLRYSIEDSHCPGRIRLTGVLSNFPDFAEAFNCRPGDAMIAEKECEIAAIRCLFSEEHNFGIR